MIDLSCKMQQKRDGKYMQLTVQGKQMDVGDALRTYVTEKLEEINSKYFNHATFATVTFSKEGHGHGQTKAHISIQLGKNIMVLADQAAGDAHSAFDSAAEKVAKQMRRYKKRLRDHHDRMEQEPEVEMLKARDYVLASEAEAPEAENDESDAPVIVAEAATDLKTLSVSEAVMLLDLSGQNALMFRNATNNELNMVYRRNDGHIGWVDPAESADAAKGLRKSA
jgi:ribosomal subunit interface protein